MESSFQRKHRSPSSTNSIAKSCGLCVPPTCAHISRTSDSKSWEAHPSSSRHSQKRIWPNGRRNSKLPVFNLSDRGTASMSASVICVRVVWAACTLLTVAVSLAQAQVFPSRPVRVIVPFAPGGGTDNLTRIMAPRLTELLGQSIIVDNRPGASSQIGTELGTRAAPDGHTLIHVDTSFASNPSLYPKLPYDAIKDFACVSLLASAPVVLVVHPSVPAKTLKELIALARTRPGELNFATGGARSATHLGVELFKSAAKIDLVHVPYKGTGPAAAALLAGEVVMSIAGPSSIKPHVDSGR